MDSTRDEENEYSSIDYSHLIIDRKSTNLTPKRSSEGNTYEEPSSAVKKREQKMFEPGETLPLVKKEERKKQNSRKSTCSIKCGLLILFILLTSALSLLFCLHYLEVVELPDGRLKAREVETQKETMLKDEISKLKNNAAESNLKVSICLGNITKLKDSSTALQHAIDDQKKKMELQAADINKLTNSASILMDTISSQKKTISEKEAAIQRNVADLTQLKSNASVLSQKVNEQKRAINQKDEEIKKLRDNSAGLLKKTNDDAKTIAEQKKAIDRHVADIGGAKNNASVMLLGGWHNYITNSITIYNSMEKSWKNCNLTLPSTLSNHGAAIINNEIYIFGGYEDGTTKEPLNSLYKLGAGNKWERMADMSEKRVSISQSSIVFNSEIWVIGGWSGTNTLKSVEKYNPKTKKWTKMPELNESRAGAAATVVDGKIYVSAGWDGRKTKNSVEVYDPEKGKWEIFTPSMPHAVGLHILIGNHSHLIAISGDLSDQVPTNEVWKIDVLDPKREWEEMPYLQQRRYFSGAAIISDGLMVFGGSINNTDRIDSVEIFDGVEWKKGAPLPEIRGAFASIPLTCAQERLFLKRYCQNS